MLYCLRSIEISFPLSLEGRGKIKCSQLRKQLTHNPLSLDGRGPGKRGAVEESQHSNTESKNPSLKTTPTLPQHDFSC